MGRSRCIPCAVALLLLTVACGRDRQTRLNVRPPNPGIPQQASDVTGIYRTTHQAVLQLRQNGSVSLIVPVPEVGPSAGTYRLEAGTFEIRTNQCGDTPGRYRLEVTGRPVAGEAILVFTALEDDCRDRSRYLTIDPWYYADS